MPYAFLPYCTFLTISTIMMVVYYRRQLWRNSRSVLACRRNRCTGRSGLPHNGHQPDHEVGREPCLPMSRRWVIVQIDSMLDQSFQHEKCGIVLIAYIARAIRYYLNTRAAIMDLLRSGCTLFDRCRLIYTPITSRYVSVRS